MLITTPHQGLVDRKREMEKGRLKEQRYRG